jgi:hypothetical protein
MRRRIELGIKRISQGVRQVLNNVVVAAGGYALTADRIRRPTTERHKSMSHIKQGVGERAV